jgi:hypothetical protein
MNWNCAERNLMVAPARVRWTVGFVLAALLLGPGSSPAQEAPVPEEGVAVLARGPVHEAFAQPAEANPQPGLVVPREPPDPVPEEPPDQKPEGDNVQWIPGYWAWDEDRGDFLWVSGFWRIPPPGRRWVPGYWGQVEGGWQWVAGFWAADDQQEVPYLDAPPESLDRGPVVPAPDDDSLYVPGTWVPREERFVWRPGFWCEARPGWVWMPAHYCWTPAGSVFVDGYWDRCLEDRGVLSAPVVFDQGLVTTPDWCYQPRFTVALANLLTSFFVRPAYDHYYFGDYYDPGYSRLGFRPWYAYGPRAYDPLYGYYRWQNQGDPSWVNGLRSTFLARRGGELPRPPHTWAEQTRLAGRFNGDPARRGPEVGALQMVTPLSQFRGDRLRLAAVDPPQRQAQQAAARQFRDVAARRGQLENAALSRRGGRPAGSLRLAPAVRQAPRVVQEHRQRPQAARPITPAGSFQREPAAFTGRMFSEAAPPRHAQGHPAPARVSPPSREAGPQHPPAHGRSPSAAPHVVTDSFATPDRAARVRNHEAQPPRGEPAPRRERHSPLPAPAGHPHPAAHPSSPPAHPHQAGHAAPPPAPRRHPPAHQGMPERQAAAPHHQPPPQPAAHHQPPAKGKGQPAHQPDKDKRHKK